MAGLNIGIFAGNLFEGPLPEAASVSHHVGLIAHQDFFSSLPARQFKSKADDPLHAFPGIEVFLGGDLVGRILLENSSGIYVRTLGVLADYYKIQVFRFYVLQGT